MRNERKYDVDFKPGEQKRMMYYSVMTQANSYIHEYTCTCTCTYTCSRVQCHVLP